MPIAHHALNFRLELGVSSQCLLPCQNAEKLRESTDETIDSDDWGKYLLEKNKIYEEVAVDKNGGKQIHTSVSLLQHR